jgi:hypothetical protein
MWLLHAGVDRKRYRELVAMKPLPDEEPPGPLEVICPKCDDLYVAELGPLRRVA